MYFGAETASPSAGALGAEDILRQQNPCLVSFKNAFSDPFGQANKFPASSGELLGVLMLVLGRGGMN